MRSLVGSTPALFRHRLPSMARERFRGTVPDGLLYDTAHDMWVRCDGDDVIMGATAYGVFRAGHIIAVTIKPRGAQIDRGRGLGTVECAKTVLALHAPVAFSLIQGNDDLEDRPAVINRDPYAAWLARGTPRQWADDAAHLVGAPEYRAHILRCEPDAELI